MGFAGYLDSEQAFQAYLRGCIDFGKTHAMATSEEKKHWLKAVFWEVPRHFPLPPYPLPSELAAFLPHESGAPLAASPHFIDWEMAIIRAESAEWPLPEDVHHTQLRKILTQLHPAQRNTEERARLAGAHFLEFRKFRQARMYAQAEDQIRLASAQFPEAAVLKTHSAWFKMLKGHLEKALLDMADLPPHFPAPSLQLAVHMGCLTRLGHPQQALDLWQQSAFPFPIGPELALILAYTLDSVGDSPSATFWWNQMAHHSFLPEGAIWFKAILAQKAGEVELAEKWRMEAKKINDLAWFTDGKI